MRIRILASNEKQLAVGKEKFSGLRDASQYSSTDLTYKVPTSTISYTNLYLFLN